MADKATAPTPNTFAGTGIAGVGGAYAQAERQRKGLEEIPTGEDRGSTLEAGQDEAVADAVAEGAAPAGLQAEPAEFTQTGSVVMNMVPSPSGPVPVNLVASDPEAAAELLEERAATVREEQERRNPDRHFTEDEVNELDGGTLRALAARRGYTDMPGAGTRSARQAFLQAQSKDDRYSSPAGRGAQTSRSATKSASKSAGSKSVEQTA